MTTPLEVQKQNRQKLVDALRSGEYEQAIGTLKTEQGFCCLGVACKVVGAEFEEYYDGQSTYFTEKQSGAVMALPHYVREQYGFSTVDGNLDINIKKCLPITSLSLLNDSGLSFEQIADVIEYEPIGLFVNE